MNQEIQLSANPGNLPVPTHPFGTGLVYNGPQQQPPTALHLIHRLLRGRYGVALVLGTLFASAGASAGFLLMRQTFQSIGLIEIQPVSENADNSEHIMPMYSLYVTSVVQKVKSEKVINEAMKDPNVRRFRPDAPATFAEINKGLLAKYVPGTTLVQVTFDSDAKDAKDFAPVLVQAIVHAYENKMVEQDEVNFKVKQDRQNGNLSTLDNQINDLQKEIDTLTATTGSSPELVIQGKQHQKELIGHDYYEANDTLEAAQVALKAAESDGTAGHYSIEDMARADTVFRGRVEALNNAIILLQNIQARGLGANHPLYKTQQAAVENLKNDLGATAKQLNSTYFIREKPDGSGGMLVKRDLSDLKTAAANKKKALDQLDQEILALHNIDVKVAENRKQIARKDEEVLKLKKQLNDNETTHQIAKTFSVVDYGGPAIVSSDKRIALSALGFMAGGGLPIGLMLLAGLMNPRVRFSDETSKEVSGLTLLGILPDLPDRLSDPEQASIAAHCVHQIRTMLQINNHTQDRRVFAVTSAAPGDGKTSLTLALGLSYAACGTRTLLIDCDLVGAGLTTRMNVNVPEGVLEAIANRSLLEFVRTTDVQDVAILPVGTGQGMHASTLSPAALRRLVDESKKHFDTVLIDTGPILGSIEASLVCAAADAVVLTVSRGQQRPLVEKSIQHLASIGARLAGVVFNRAQASDFERSISGMSVRSNPATQGGRMGPVARAVQSSYRGAQQD